MNVDKTNIMVFSKNKANDISVKLNEITITKVEHCRYLGIFLCYDSAVDLTLGCKLGSFYNKHLLFYLARSANLPTGLYILPSVGSTAPVSYTHLTLPTIYSV